MSARVRWAKHFGQAKYVQNIRENRNDPARAFRPADATDVLASLGVSSRP